MNHHDSTDQSQKVEEKVIRYVGNKSYRENNDILQVTMRDQTNRTIKVDIYL